MTQHPEVLLFDIGGVLVENSAFSELQRLSSGALDDARVRARWLASPSVKAFELGHISPAEFANRFVQEWNLGLAPEAFLAEFAGWPRGLFSGAEDLLLQLRSRHRVACLTNSNESHWSRLRELNHLFDQAFSSHELGLIKPDPGIFRCVIERLAVESDRIAFFDDSLPNVEAAAGAGMRAYHVVGFDALRLTLSRLGLHR